ncbi:MAG: hypothetical protein ACYSUL_04240 [Planctomycetota bacterium]
MLSVVGYTLTARVSAKRHRYQYLIDYQSARYACDAGTKYAIVNLANMSPKLIGRSNLPDFSDLFALTDEEYQLLLDDWTAQKISKEAQKALKAADAYNINSISGDPLYGDFLDICDINLPFDNFDINGANTINMMKKAKSEEQFIPGPYGQKWPLVSKPINFKIGSSKIKIEIEDENAKYPLGWALLKQGNVQLESLAAFKTFCEWMNINDQEFLSLKNDLDQIAQIKSFKLGFKASTKEKRVTEEKEVKRGNRTVKVPKRTIKKTKIPASAHTAAFAYMFNSSLINSDILARPATLSEKRKESALKYMGLWGSNKVNINTAPRHILEAVFTFGGDAAQIAEEIIQLRQIKPIKDIEELRKNLLRYSESIEKTKPYITTTSDFFTIRVTATSGTATTMNVIAIRKGSRGIETIALLSG